MISTKGNTLTITLSVSTFTISIGTASALSMIAYYYIRPRPTKHKYPATTAEDFNAWGGKLLRWISDYRESCRDLPVISRVEPNYLQKALPTSAPNSPESYEAIMSDLDSKILPGLTNWEASNKFFAYFKPHASYPAVLGETLCAGLNVMGFDWIASPACTELEVVTLDWLAQFLNLPDCFLHSSPGPGGGVIQGSAGESATVVLLAAAKRKDADRSKMVVYISDQTHAIAEKATMIIGTQFRSIKTSPSNNLTLQADDLEKQIKEDIKKGLTPIAVVATTGTTSSCAFDPLPPINAVAKKYDLWVHVDAAYGGAYACLPEYRDKFVGLEDVDSFCVNCHKKLMCPFDIAALYVANRRPILDALSLQPEYLRNAHSESGAVVDFEHWQMPLGRRFRSLKLWFVMRRFGTQGMREHVKNGVNLAKYLAAKIEASDDFELAAPVSLSLVCFRWKGRSEEDQKKLLDAVKATGDCFIIHTKLDGKIVIRVACGGIEQDEEDIDYCFSVMTKSARAL
ncbi:hypothetical protein TrCOL_g13058 [Triparma columacea]|uniref:Uncharacterized protein n=1 Tax=Triparma columacea TaxID=722753 RepID=A0A9W7L4M0_9STRA|nr:hypothetical protein TrCOL_g13058 [Triparma columacea]